MDEQPKKKREKKPRSTRNKRIVLFVVGVSLGVICRLLPPQHQGVCNVVARVLAFVIGAPT